MKIRIFKNSIRIRVSKTDLKNFSVDGVIEEITHFGNQSLIYKLVKSESVENLDADFINNTITMFVPSAKADEWANSEQVGINYKKPLADNERLSLLLEKDFKCLDNTGNEDQSDNFENPNHTC